MMWPASLQLLYSALWRVLPAWLIAPLEWLPSQETVRLNHFRDVAMKVSRPIFEKQLKEVTNDANPAEKDVVNVLGMFDGCYLTSLSHLCSALAHLNDDAKKKMDDTEIDSQLA